MSPFLSADSNRSTDAHSLVEGARRSKAVPRVLLVDDDPVLLQGLCDMLTSAREKNDVQ